VTVVSVNSNAPQPELIAEAARIVCGGGLVAFPTETVYGLGADAANPDAIARLNQVKGRPPEKPYSLHLADAAQVEEFVEAIPPLAQRLIKAFWPGPLTIVMPAKGGGTVGFRLPNHPVALALLRQCGRVVVAPSANRSGSPPPTDGREVVAALNGAYDYLLDAGPTPLGRESTVVSVVDDRLAILREGALTAKALDEALSP
jgi:L-threonylcarbamoyladenylate synthase